MRLARVRHSPKCPVSVTLMYKKETDNIARINKKPTTSYSMNDKNKSIRELVIIMSRVPLKSCLQVRVNAINK